MFCSFVYVQIDSNLNLLYSLPYMTIVFDKLTLFSLVGDRLCEASWLVTYFD